MTTFAALGTPKALADTLTAQGIIEPFPIQVDTLPDTLAGRDVLGRGRTGSGKTIAFAIPLVARLAEREAGHSASPAARWASSSRRPASWPPRSPPTSSRWPRPWA